jgi:acyl dehydratase
LALKIVTPLFGDPGAAMSKIRNRTIQGLQEGDTFTIKRQFSQADMQAFADITRDYNAVHFDSRFAAAKHFRDRICHGLLVGSLLTEVGGQIGWLASVMNFKFRQPVYFGDTITCKFTITRIDERQRAKAKAHYFNTDGDLVLEAELEGILPDKTERQILDAMVREGDPSNKLR